MRSDTQRVFRRKVVGGQEDELIYIVLGLAAKKSA